MNTARVVIIGAGPSGIAAATRLVERGFRNVLILEAESRIGGRIHTVPFGDNTVDMGAQWCHGEVGNVVYDLVKDSNVLGTTGDVYERYECVRSNGEVLSEVLTQKLKAIFDEYWARKDEGLKEYEGSLGTFLVEAFNAALRREEYAGIDKSVAREFLDSCKKFEVSMECCDTLFEVSGRGHLDYWSCAGDHLLNWKDKGFVTLLRRLMQTEGLDFGVLNRKIQLNREVAEVQWSPDGLGPIQIRCADGITIEADHVICSVSLGVLKERHANLFQPNLPEQKIRAIRGLGIGTVNKIFLEFPTQFWPDTWTGFNLLWTESDLIELRASKHAWLENVFGFYIVADQPRILSGWIVGPSARHAETLPKDEVLRRIMYLLRRFLKWDIPAPVDCIVTAWYSNPHFRGSYSHRSMQTEELQTGASDLAVPVTSPASGKPILQFCGEASHDHFYSTVHGAVETGWREAERLSEFYSDKKSKL